MIRIMLTRCWPALIPIAIYLLWFWLARRAAVKAGETPPSFFEGPWKWAAIATVITLTVFLFAIPLSPTSNKGTNYQPKQLIDGKLVPETLE